MGLFNRLTGFANAVKGAVIQIIDHLPRPEWVEEEQWRKDEGEGNPLIDDRDLDRVEAPRRGSIAPFQSLVGKPELRSQRNSRGESSRSASPVFSPWNIRPLYINRTGLADLLESDLR